MILIIIQVVSRFPYALVKFDKPHAYGETQKAFKAFVPSTIQTEKLLVATVGIKGNIILVREEMKVINCIRFGLKKLLLCK